MLHAHGLQLSYNLSDPAMEDALYEIESMRRFAGLRLSERIPDEATILNFRHFLESRRLGKVIFDTINRHLADAGLMLKKAPLLTPPSSKRRALPRTARRLAIQRCSKPARATSGTLA